MIAIQSSYGTLVFVGQTELPRRTTTSAKTVKACVHGARQSLRRPLINDSLRSSKANTCGRSLRLQCLNSDRPQVTLLDYGVGNVRSVRNAIKYLGYDVREVNTPTDISSAERLIFPGVGSFGAAMDILNEKGFTEPLKDYLLEGKPFLGICLGMQLLFEGSEESSGVEGLGVVPGLVTAFDPSLGLPIPHMGWNGVEQRQESAVLERMGEGDRVYFVHSFRALETPENKEWVLSTSDYGGEFVSAIRKGAVHAMQFHPEKSGNLGLELVKGFLEGKGDAPPQGPLPATAARSATTLAKRVIACLDVRANDDGDLVVTKGDGYDVREKGGEGDVRNLGLPVDLSARYFAEGADEVTFLNITGFRDFPLGDMPMLQVLRAASERVFVPLTVGGGIRDFTDQNGKHYSAVEVAAEYFRSGADKISIGSDAVFAAEALMANDGVPTGSTAIEQISYRYGKQAVVVSIDPRRVWVSDPADTPNKTVKSTAYKGPNGEEHCWYQCTVSGGREGRPIGAYELATAVETLGAGEILLNCIDKDGKGDGFDIDLVEMVSDAVSIPVIASSGAGEPLHFSEVFQKTGAAAALAAGIFHRKEVEIGSVKSHMADEGIATRM